MSRELPNSSQPLNEGGNPTVPYYAWFSELNRRLKSIFPDAPSDGQQYGRQNANWTVIQPANTTPGGSNTSVQFNNAGVFGGIANVTSDGTNFTALGLAGNQTVVGAGRRFFADTDSATVANRFAFQDSVTNAATVLNVIPNGTNTNAYFIAYNQASMTNAGVVTMKIDSTRASIACSHYGAGTTVPLRFEMNPPGNLVAAVWPNGNWRFGSTFTDPGVPFRVDGNAVFGGTLTVTGGISAPPSHLFQVDGSTFLDGTLRVGQVATFQSVVLTAAPTVSAAGLRLPHGTAPNAPVNGDLWTTSEGLFICVNGLTIGPMVGGDVAGELLIDDEFNLLVDDAFNALTVG